MLFDEKILGVSICTPVFNTGNLLYDLENSIREIVDIDCEWIIVNDHSDETTTNILKDIEGRNEMVKVFDNPGNGACSARNYAFSKSKYTYIKFIDADDYFEKGFVEDQLKSTNKECCVVYSPTKTLTQTTYSSEIKISKKSLKFMPEDITLSHLSNISGFPGNFLLHRSLVVKVGGWDESLLADQDGDFIMRVGLLQPYCRMITDKYFIYRNHNFNQRISTEITEEKISSRLKVILKLFNVIEPEEKYQKYRLPLAKRADALSRLAVIKYKDLSDKCLSVAKNISPLYTTDDPLLYKIFRTCIGLRKTELVKRKIKHQSI